MNTRDISHMYLSCMVGIYRYLLCFHYQWTFYLRNVPKVIINKRSQQKFDIRDEVHLYEQLPTFTIL